MKTKTIELTTRELKIIVAGLERNYTGDDFDNYGVDCFGFAGIKYKELHDKLLPLIDDAAFKKKLRK